MLYVLANEPTGGVGVFVRDFCLHFDECVHVDYLIYTSQRDTVFQNTIRREDTKIHYLPDMTIRSYYSLLKKTDDFFKEHAGEYDAVHLTYPGQVSMVLKPAKKYGVPCRIIHSFNTRLSDDPLKSIRNKLFILNYRRYANVFLACSKMAGEYLYGKKAAFSGEVKYIMNAVRVEDWRYDPEKREEVRRKLGIGKEEKVILAAGRLEKQKNIGFAADVFRSLHEKEPDSRLVIIGDGPLKGEIEEKVRNFHLENKVMFQSFTNDLNSFFLASDVLLFPSLYEGLPLTVVDAQCCGLPCVLSDTISEEVRLTDLVTYCSLKQESGIWADRCLAVTHEKRSGREDEITEKGYNVAQEALKLEEVYLDFEEQTDEDE